MTLKDRLKNISFESNPKIVEEIPFSEFITDALSQKISTIPVWYDYDYSKQFELILNFLDNKLNSEFEDLTLSESEKRAIAEEFLKTNNGFGVLDKLIADENITSLTVNSLGSVYVCSGGHYRKTELVLSKKQFNDIAARFKGDSPVVRLRQDNLFITLLCPPVSDNMLIIRKIKDVFETLDDLVKIGVITDELKTFLEYLLNNKKNIIVSGESESVCGDFIQVLINSVDESKRIAVIEDNGIYKVNLDNVSAFSVASLDEFDYEYILSSVRELYPDYTVTRLNDYKKMLSFYLGVSDITGGLVTEVRARSAADASNKLVNLGMTALKSTEKQAKTKLSSSYDYIVHLAKSDDNSFIIDSIMEITSTKTSSLVLNEVVKSVDGVYALDLPEEILNVERNNGDQSSVLKSFRQRLK